jgi:hypothetical protein
MGLLILGGFAGCSPIIRHLGWSSITSQSSARSRFWSELTSFIGSGPRARGARLPAEPRSEICQGRPAPPGRFFSLPPGRCSRHLGEFPPRAPDYHANRFEVSGDALI